MDTQRTPEKKELAPIQKLLHQIEEHIESNPNHYEGLKASFTELCNKADELKASISEQRDLSKVSEQLIEMEQAADSALKVAKSTGDQKCIDEIQEAHDRIKEFKDQYWN